MDIDSIQRGWQMRAAYELQQMCNRIELTLAWHDLDALLVESLAVVQQPNGIWRARSVPATRGQERRIRQTAINALAVCAGSAHDRGINRNVFDSRNVADAKRMVRAALMTSPLGDPCA